MTERQRKILETVYRRKNPLEPELETGLEEVWLECGSFAPAVFLQDWKALVEERLVIGSPTNESNQKIIGTGRITASGEEALKESRSKESGE
jgi:hypothetical protein